MANVVRFALSTARTLHVPGAGVFVDGVLDVDANNLDLLIRTRWLVQPFRAVELGTVDSATPKPSLPAVPGPPAPDPYPQYLTATEAAALPELRAASVTGRTALAQRHSRRARAELDAFLGETLPGTSIAGPMLEATAQIAGGSWVETIPGGVLNPNIRWTGANIVQAGAGFPNSVCVTGVGLDSAAGGLPFAAEFIYTGSQFEFDYKWRTDPANFRVYADGVIVGSVFGPSGTPDGSFYKHLVTLPDARPRRIRVEFNGQSFVYGFFIQPSTSISYPSGKAKGPRAIFFGDSYVEGAGASSDFTTLHYYLSKSMGWDDLWRSGSGGTGYLNVPTSPTGRKTLRQRAQTDVINQNPQIVIIAAGINDRTFADAALAPEAGLLFDMLRSALPNTEFVVVGPWGPRDRSMQDAANLATTAAIRSQAEVRGMYFIDPIAEDWITGTGYVGATTGGGNSDTFIGPDGTHPTDAGHAYLAQRLAGHLRTLGAVSV